MDIDRDDFINKLFDLGYEKKPVVSRTGEMAIRGYVIDIFPIEFDNPIRIEFWGDTIDSIKYFDLDDQISNTSVDSVKIYPYTEFLIDGKIGDNIIRKQKYLLNYSDSVSGLWNYVSDSVIFYYDYNQIINSYSLLRENILEYDSELDDDIKTNYMWDIEDISNKHNIYILDIDNLIDLDVNNKKYVSHSIENYCGNFEKLKLDLIRYIKSGKTVILCVDDRNVVKRIVTYLELDDIIFTDENNIINNKILYLFFSGININFYILKYFFHFYILNFIIFQLTLIFQTKYSLYLNIQRAFY